MPAKDITHDSVKNGLIKEGWVITHDPLFIQFGGVDVYVDLGAEKIIAAEKENEKIAVEVKSFVKPSVITDFHTAIGQYINYRVALAEEKNRFLYLAVPNDIYKSFFSLPFTKTVIETNQVKLIVYDSNKEEILEWKK